MLKDKFDKIYILLILIISIILVFELFFNKGQSQNMDGTVHITTIAQFFQAMKQGDIKITWADGFANYGMPIPIFAHQIPSYLGAIINFVTNNAITSFNIVNFIGTFLSLLFFYIFLRLYFNPLYSFLGVFLFNLAPYRILNVYIRGAIPEYFASLFLPLILISIYYIVKKRKYSYAFLLSLSITGLVLTHPMILVVYSFIIFPYLFYYLFLEKKNKLKLLIYCAGSMIFGLFLASYYLIPLFREIKYFYYGQTKNQLEPNQTLGLINYISPNWYYFFKNDILCRGHFVKSGVIEFIGVLIGILILIYRFLIKKRKPKDFLFIGSILLSIVLIFLTTKYSDFLYKNISILGNIQFPWRMMSSFIFLPPILFAYYFKKINKPVLAIVFILLIAFIRFPQLYGKNYTLHSQNYYYFTSINLHATEMNTIWTGETDDYPIKENKGEIIEGDGKILQRVEKNSWRKYKVKANTDIRMVDNTFYFPGWKVYIDGKDTEIEFQDMNYRGTITYRVPKGEHEVYLKFTETKVRKFGNILSILSLIFFLFVYIFRKKLFKILRLK